ncbi:hypothetical protein [Methylobacter sp. S3L5C]|uniref:hypothetical protein n=1 Tax=Methylobacter sp. S3L5C TaxID=2839024 RepID=UPI001FAB5D0C|nr:hypothetical protein [Methylobacter sp. S3L5C]UOA08974.1 hypothetical protein KKZ03_01240 [Methylobacter sp. S3L5C]
MTDITIKTTESSKQVVNSRQKPDTSRADQKIIAMPASSFLVPLTSSKKLAAIRKQSQSVQVLEKKPVPSSQIKLSGQHKDTDALLVEAQEQINAKINELMAIYPQGRKNKMFAIKYGTPESIKQMTIKAIFTRLAMVKPKNFAAIENLDYFGNATL